MAESIIAVADGDYRFDLDVVRAAVADRWPAAEFIPAGGRVAAVSAGQFEIPEPGVGATVLLDVDLGGRSLGVEAGDPTDAADVIAWVTRLPGFPGDGSVILAEWAIDFVPLAPGTSTATLLDIQA